MKSGLLMSIPSATNATLTPWPVASDAAWSAWMIDSASGSTMGLDGLVGQICWPPFGTVGDALRGPRRDSPPVIPGFGRWTNVSGRTCATAEFAASLARSVFDTVAAKALTVLYVRVTLPPELRTDACSELWFCWIAPCRAERWPRVGGRFAYWLRIRTITRAGELDCPPWT